jgi:hypothetical protein
MQKIIKDSIADANAVTKVSQERAKAMFIREFSPAVKSLLAEVINEEVSTGNDQPGGYEPEADQDALVDVSAGDVNAKGKGPWQADASNTLAQKVKEGEDLPTDDENPDEEVFELGEPEIPGETEPDEDDLGLGEGFDTPEDEIPGDEEGEEVIEVADDVPAEDEIPGEEEVLEVVEEPAEEEPKEDELMERKLRKVAKRLYKENIQLKKTVNFLKERFNKLDLFNAKLAYAFKLMHQPGITRQEKKQIAETFDKAKSVREAKLIYSTLRQNFATKIRHRQPILRTNNVKSVLSESTNVQNSGDARFETLAGLKDPYA